MPQPSLLGLAIGIAVAAAVFWLALRAVLRHAAKPRATRAEMLSAPAGADVLVVLAHGLTGRASFEGAVELVAEILPAADRLVVDYDSSPSVREIAAGIGTAAATASDGDETARDVEVEVIEAVR